jgi:hypothetical protein
MELREFAAREVTALADRLLDGPVAKSELVFEVSACDKLFDPRPYVDWDKLRRQPADPRRTLTFDLSGVADPAPLRQALARHGARRLVVAGDLLEEARREGGVVNELREWLDQAGLELAALVPGNHDRGLAGGSGLRLCRRGFALGGWRVVHGDATLPGGRLVQGHEHPCVRWPGLPAAPCYLLAEGRLVLPAYSPDAAGVNVVGAPRWAAYRCAVIAGDAVLDFGEVRRLRSLACSPPAG